MLIDSTIYLVSILNGKSTVGGYTFGNIDLKFEDIEHLELLQRNELLEIFTVIDESILVEELNHHLSKNIKIELKSGDINNYFETVNDFIYGNKFECRLEDFYIREIFFRENASENPIINLYRKNLRLISFLRFLADKESKTDAGLELFFYKSNLGADLLIDYSQTTLTDFDDGMLDAFKSQFLDPVSGEDKKQLFINDLINAIKICGNSYSTFVQGWGQLTATYNKSFLLFIAGFSFEKIKTASNEHFQKLVDKISELIGKASTYIFGVPIAYILLLNSFDYRGIEVGRNFILLLLGSIFLIMIWQVLFKNIEESIYNIQFEIDDFIEKISSVAALDEIKIRLNRLKTIDLKKQKYKLVIVKILTCSIYLIFWVVYLYVFIDVSIFYLN